MVAEYDLHFRHLRPTIDVRISKISASSFVFTSLSLSNNFNFTSRITNVADIKIFFQELELISHDESNKEIYRICSN